MKSIAVNSLRPFSPPPGTLYLDEEYILCTPDINLPQYLHQTLSDWGYSEILLEENVSSFTPSVRNLAEGDVTHVFIEETGKETNQKKEANKYYVEFLENLQKTTDNFSKKGSLNVEEVATQAKEIYSQLKSYRKYLLKMTELDRNGFPYLTCHSVNTAILSMAIAESMKIPAHRIIEIGMGALLHEIGMLHQNYAKIQSADRELNADEIKSLRAHPVLSYKIIKEKGFPVSVCMTALEHHEREDGKGYPQALKADAITAGAKIISVASVYDAQVSTRPHRESRDAHSTILDLIKEMGKGYHEQVVKHLVLTLGLYPLGTFVELTDGAYAQVVDFEPETPKTPQLKLLTNKEKKPLSEFPIVKTGEKPEWNIVKAMSREDAFKLKNNGII